MTLDALTAASVHSLWSSPKCLNRLCLTVFSSLWSSLLLVHIFPLNFFLPVNFAFNMLWYSTPWTVTPFSNDPLWLILFVEVLMIVFWTIAKSAVFPIIVLSKNKRYTVYTVWMVIYWNSNINIIIFWDTNFWLSLAVSSNHQNVFYFTCNESKIYENFTFWNKLQEKSNFFTIFQFFRCTCEWVCFFIRLHYITSSPMDPLQWMGAVRMRADKKITIIHTMLINIVRSKSCVLVRNP